MEVAVYNLAGDKTGTMEVDAACFGEPAAPSLLHRAVVSYEANLRQGNANTRTRGDRAGSGKKLWAQKGTGRARMGSIRSPLWRKGGVVFGPKPRDYRMKLSKRERCAALRMSLAGKLRDGEMRVVERMDLAEPKTRLVAGFLKKAVPGGRVLFVAAAVNGVFLRAARNIARVEVLPLADLNALEVLKGGTLVFEKSAVEDLIRRLREAAA